MRPTDSFAVPIHMFGPRFPDAPDCGPCCWGSATHGPAYCTCWLPVFDVDQQPADASQPVTWALERCHDCAYRPDSPERNSGDVAFDADDLDHIVANAEPFACHQGIRRPLHWQHPSGATMPAHPANYQPLIAPASIVPGVIEVKGWPYRADGRPADLCAGWTQRRAQHIRETEEATA